MTPLQKQFVPKQYYNPSLLRLDVIPEPIRSENNEFTILEIGPVNIWGCCNPIPIELYSAPEEEKKKLRMIIRF
jgi:hypothetical protein